MRAALERRNREITAKVDKLFQDRLGASGPTWEDVVALTPRGNATERHVAYAALLRLRDLAAKQGKSLADIVTACCGAAPPAGSDDATLQIFLRAKLLKAGAPCLRARRRGRFCFGGGACAGSSWPSDRFRLTRYWEIRFWPASRILKLFWTGWKAAAFTPWKSFPTAIRANA